MTDRDAAIAAMRARMAKKNKTKKVTKEVEVVGEQNSLDAKPLGILSNYDAIPYRKNTNQYAITEVLVRGGVRSEMAESLRGRLNIWKRGKNREGKQRTEIEELDYRIMKQIGALKRLGWKVETTGRGLSQVVFVKPPAGKKVAVQKSVDVPQKTVRRPLKTRKVKDD